MEHSPFDGPTVMHPVNYLYCTIPYLSLGSLFLNLQMQAEHTGWGETAQSTQTQQRMYTSCPDQPQNWFCTWPIMPKLTLGLDFRVCGVQVSIHIITFTYTVVQLSNL